MKEQLISFETAKLAKEKRFDEHGIIWELKDEWGIELKLKNVDV